MATITSIADRFEILPELNVKTGFALLSEDERVVFEERAAIMEYDGELPRAEAEKRALDSLVTHRGKGK